LFQKKTSVFILNTSNSKKEKVLWFTGLSGSGKTSIALGIKSRLEELGFKVVIIDGDDVREKLHKHLGFSREDIKENNRLISDIAVEALQKNDFVLVPIISPYKKDRLAARTRIGEEFVELYINASLEECRKRDTKGLYEKAQRGEIDNMIGVSEKSPYEPPKNPDIEVCTDDKSSVESVEEVMRALKLN
tara:strand:+ start:16327 stop:16896 length:570 start_codon:yes stop_codon:yes gene_type:complete